MADKKAEPKVIKSLWDEAERMVVSNGLGGVGEAGRKDLIQDQYDKMIANDKAVKDWAGDSPILGDI